MSDTMQYMSGAGTLIGALGQIMSGNSAASAGQAQKEAADYSAQVLRTQAGQTMAAAEGQVANQNINTQYMLSATRARAAAGGGGATDPGVVSLEGQIAARGEYNVQSLIYTGQEKASGLSDQANLDEYTGQQQLLAGQAKQKASYIGAAGTALSGFGGLAAKYGWFSGASSSGGLAAAQNPSASGGFAGGLT